MAPWIFPKRQWKSNLRWYPGGVTSGLIEDAAEPTPYPGSHLTSFVYSPATLALTVGVAMSPAVPVILPAGARVVVFWITPNLPAGLVFQNGTGTISGTPTTPQAPTAYQVRADAAMSYFTTITIGVT